MSSSAGHVRVRAATAIDAPFILGLVARFVAFDLPGDRAADLATAFARSLRDALTAITTNHHALGFYERLGFTPETVTLVKPLAA